MMSSFSTAARLQNITMDSENYTKVVGYGFYDTDVNASISERITNFFGTTDGKLSVDLPTIQLKATNFEWESVDHDYWAKWMTDRYSLCAWMVVTYVTLVFASQKWMQNRAPFKLRNTLMLWNVGLTIFSVMAFVRSLPEFLDVMSEPQGFYKSVCSAEERTVTRVFYEYWGTWFKAIELGDTAFIILRKQPLIFLHWWHHATVLAYTWVFIPTNDSSHLWPLVTNSGIHSLMYSYYALRAFGIKLPKKLAITITSLQIVQMFVGLFINVYSAHVKMGGHDCARTNAGILSSFLMYLSYCLLFINFFVRVYLGKPKAKQIKKTEEQEAQVNQSVIKAKSE